VKVSVITVCYNAAECIENAITSVLSQTYKNIEYIIVDGMSTDGTLDIINNYRDKISTFISEKDNGIYDAMNKGIGIAAGDVIYFLNSDDILFDEDVIRDVVSEFKKTKGLSLLYGNVIYEDKAKFSEVLRKFDKVNRKNLIHGNLCHQAIFAKRFLFDEIGKFDLKYKINADYDWLLKVFLSNKYVIAYFDRIIAKFNYGGYHVKNAQLANEERLYVKLKHYNKLDFYLRDFLFKAKRKLLKIYKIIYTHVKFS